MAPTWTNARARLANAERYKDAQRAAQARADLARIRVERKIADAVAAAPPLPEAVRTRLIELIRTIPTQNTPPAGPVTPRRGRVAPPRNGAA